jgi:hypothetical protein
VAVVSESYLRSLCTPSRASLPALPRNANAKILLAALISWSWVVSTFNGISFGTVSHLRFAWVLIYPLALTYGHDIETCIHLPFQFVHARIAQGFAQGQLAIIPMLCW